MSGVLDKLRHKNAGSPATTTLPPAHTTPLNTTQPSLMKETLNTGSTQVLPTHATTHVAAPIIEETVRNDRVLEVQPVLHREVDKNIVHHIEKHSFERAPSASGVIERQPIIDQQVHTNVVNEIQPIIHRERVVPVVERAEQHLSERISEPAVHTREVVYEGSRAVPVQQSTAVLQKNAPPLRANTSEAVAPAQVTHSLAPIVQESIRQDKVVEVQPIVHREVDKNIVHHIEKHIVERAPSQSGVIERQPIVEENLHTNVVNEIQPIIHRERVIPVVERAEQHLSQKISEAPIHTHEVIYERAPVVPVKQNTILQTNAPALREGTTEAVAAQQVTHALAPIVQETIRQDKVVEVQPVVHQQIDKSIVHHIEKHIVERAPSQAGVVERQPIVQENLHTNVVNEIQPIIHRERVVPVVERTEQHLSQKISEAPIHTHEVIYERAPVVPVQQNAILQTNAPALRESSNISAAPTQTTHALAPIVQETIRQDKVVEVQPVVHRAIDKNIVHHIEKHSFEAAPHMGGVVERQPIVQERLNTQVVNEIQPIIHRERVVPVVERTEQHLSQRVSEAPIHTHEVVYEQAPVQPLQQSTTVLQRNAPALREGINTTAAPTQVTHALAPVIQETVRQDRVVEVQPILHRSIDKNIVHHIEKHSFEPAPSASGVIQHQPIVQEKLVTQVVNEIQPIIHRERVVPVLEKTERHLTQHIVEPAIHTHEVIYEGAVLQQSAGYQQNSGLRQSFGLQQNMGLQQTTLLQQQSLGLQQQNLGLQQGFQQQNLGLQQQNLGLQQGLVQQRSYQGLNLPYTNAAPHPTYGYMRLPAHGKAERYEQKALNWERRGYMKQAQKNREKAMRYRARTQPGYVAPPRTQEYYINKASLLDQKAVQYQQWGMMPQAQRYQGRSARLRQKHNLIGLQQQLQQQSLGHQQPIGLQQQSLGLQQQPLGLQQQSLGLQQPIGLQQQTTGLQQQNLGVQQGLQNLSLQDRNLGQQGIQQPNLAGLQQQNLGLQQQQPLSGNTLSKQQQQQQQQPQLSWTLQGTNQSMHSAP